MLTNTSAERVWHSSRTHIDLHPSAQRRHTSMQSRGVQHSKGLGLWYYKDITDTSSVTPEKDISHTCHGEHTPARSCMWILLVLFEMDSGMESSFTFVVCVRGPANPHCPKPFWVFGSLALLFLLDKQSNLWRLIDVVIFHAICIYLSFVCWFRFPRVTG